MSQPQPAREFQDGPGVLRGSHRILFNEMNYLLLD